MPIISPAGSWLKSRTGIVAGGLLTLTLGTIASISLYMQNDSIELQGTAADSDTPYSSAWQRVSANFSMDHHVDDPRVQQWITWYQEHPRMFADYAKTSAPWMHYVVRQVEARGLPGEVALLPFVESGYNPYARSPKGPSGMWQLATATASDMGLDNRVGYLARQDVVASTRAALDYLEMMNHQWYHGDWDSTLAAYNAGPGRVNLARVQSGTQDFWKTALPEETRNYVPKLLALAEIVSHPQKYGIDLQHVADKPSFDVISLDHSLDLASAARLAGIDVSELKLYNPAYIGNWTGDTLLVPTSVGKHFKNELARVKNGDTQLQYVVNQGDTLSTISQRAGIPVKRIEQDNQLDGKSIKVGQTLMLASA